jgi:DNA polymerase-3 subunit delta
MQEVYLLHILIGEDDFSSHQALETIKKSAGDPTALMPNTTELEGTKVTPGQLRAACETVPFLADKRLVIVAGLLARFEPKKKNGRKKSSRQTEPAEDCQPFTDAIKNLPPFTELVLIDGGGIKSANPLLHEISPGAKVSSFPLLKKPGQLIQWIEKRVAAQSKAGISKKAADLMARLVGSDLWTMANEIDKLVLYTSGRVIEESDVRAVVSNVQEIKLYNLSDAIIESNNVEAQKLLQQLFKHGFVPTQILFALAGHVSLILRIKEMRKKGRSLAELQSVFRSTPPYTVQKAWSQADKYSPPRLKEVYHKLLDADIAIKTGKYDNPELVMDVLLAEIGQGNKVSA